MQFSVRCIVLIRDAGSINGIEQVLGIVKEHTDHIILGIKPSGEEKEEKKCGATLHTSSLKTKKVALGPPFPIRFCVITSQVELRQLSFGGWSLSHSVPW